MESDTAREGLERFATACEDALRAGVPLHGLYRAVTDAYEQWDDERLREAAERALADALGARPVNTDIIKPGLDDTPEIVNVGE